MQKICTVVAALAMVPIKAFAEDPCTDRPACCFRKTTARSNWLLSLTGECGAHSNPHGARRTTRLCKEPKGRHLLFRLIQHVAADTAAED